MLDALIRADLLNVNATLALPETEESVLILMNVRFPFIRVTSMPPALTLVDLLCVDVDHDLMVLRASEATGINVRTLMSVRTELIGVTKMQNAQMRSVIIHVRAKVDMRATERIVWTLTNVLSGQIPAKKILNVTI